VGLSRQKQLLAAAAAAKKQQLPKGRLQRTEFGNSHFGDSFQAQEVNKE
jgi:hypothetical protein